MTTEATPTDAGAVPANATTETATPATPEPTAEEAALEAMDAGIADATPAPVEPQAPAADPVPGDADAAKAAAKSADAGQSKPDADAQAAAPKPDEATEAEIKGFALKEKSAERFRELSGQAREYAPVKEALAKAGFTDAAKFAEAIPQLVQRSKDFEDIVSMVTETGATADQYSAALGYLTDVHKAMAGDVAAAQRAYDKIQGEVAALAQMLGKEAPGVDPLAQYADLKQDVENGDISRQRALEIAAARVQGNMYQAGAQRQAQEHDQQAAVAQGRQALNALGAELAQADPDYARKQPYLLPALQAITAAMPPAQWAQATREAYARIPALPEAPKPKPAPGPMRTVGPRPVLTPTTDDPMEAMNMGIAAAG